jgi:hypothetical protein
MKTNLMLAAAYVAAFLLPLVWDVLVNGGHPF